MTERNRAREREREMDGRVCNMLRVNLKQNVKNVTNHRNVCGRSRTTNTYSIGCNAILTTDRETVDRASESSSDLH